VWCVRARFVSGGLTRHGFIGVQSIFIVALTGTFSAGGAALQMVHSSSIQAEGLIGGVVAPP
jgi:hypothetical protein